MKKTAKIKDWHKLTDDEILQMRVRDLNLQIAGSPLESLINRLYDELTEKGISFRPKCYLADEWLCPDKMAIIGVPFCLVHPRLKHIEKKMMYEVEGGTEKACMKLLRHECGHALNYAYQLYKKTRWRELFGPFTTKYSNSYYAQPYSRRYVIHLADNYAQAHPDEDFAETFAVWLRPGGNWQQKYRDWPVIKKLRYVDGTMKRICDKEVYAAISNRPPWSAARMTSTLAVYYERKRKALGKEFRGFYDDSLKELFMSKRARHANLKASSLLRNRRRELIDNVTRWTGHRKYDIHQLINRLIRRSDALELFANKEDIVGVTALLTVIASNTVNVPRRHGS